MNPTYEPKADQTSVTYAIWYYYTPGTLQSHNGLPENAPIKSKVDFNWLVPIGSKFDCKGSNFNHFIVNVEITHDNKEIVDEDLKYFMDVWRPNIV